MDRPPRPPSGLRLESTPLSPTSQSFFQNASNFSIGTQNVTINNETLANVIGGVDPPQAIPDASHNRNRKSSPPDSNCFPGTRVALISKILSWAKGDEDGQLILWLCGSVGSGKSAIAQAVAEELDRCHHLAASFFFFRGSGERSRFARFPITLANQIALAVPETRRYILDAVARYSGWSVSKQMEELVYQPIRLAFANSPTKGPLIIIVDGLDECGDRDEVEEFIDHLLEYFENNTLPSLRFIIASRIEEHIQSRLETESVQIENLASHLSDNDIFTFLTASFARAAKQSRVIRAYGKWPTEQDLKNLLTHISGSFIFATTLVKYIVGSSDDGLTPMERLPLALEMNPGLDGLYAETLGRCSTFPHFTEVIAAIALEDDPMSISALSWLLGVPPYRILNVLVNLQAIIHVPGDDHTPVTFFHTSLHDFLTTESRSGPLFLSKIHHERFAFRWLEAETPPGSTQVEFCRQCFRMDCHTVKRAQGHWSARWHGLRCGLPETFRFINAIMEHFFYWGPGGRGGDALAYFSAHNGPFRDSIFVPVLLSVVGDAIDLREALVSRGVPPPPRFHTVLVRGGVRLFNGCLLFETGAKLGEYMLRHWVKHLGESVQGETVLPEGVLRKRNFQAVSHTFHESLRSRICSISMSSKEIGGLIEDVLWTERAIEARFPGLLQDLPIIQGSGPLDFKATFHGLERLGKNSRPKISEVGVSILDIFNAYRSFPLMKSIPPRASATMSGLPSHFDLTFTNERQNHLKSELSLRRYPHGLASKEGPIYIAFYLDYFVF